MASSVQAAEQGQRSMRAPAVSSADRRAVGRAARKRVPRRRLGDWDPAARGHDALATVLAQNETRVPDLVPIRMSRMSASPWTYYRGAAAVMAADLAASRHSGIDVQLCGDAHVLNFGLWATPERQLSFDLRDLICVISTKPCAAPSNGMSSATGPASSCWPGTTACPTAPRGPRCMPRCAPTVRGSRRTRPPTS